MTDSATAHRAHWRAVRAEIGPLLRLAGPIVGAQLAFMGMSVTDTMLAGQLSARDLAAVAVGANLWMLGFVPAMGICMAMSPIIAQQCGADAPLALRAATVRRGHRLGFGVGLVWMALVLAGAPSVVALLELPDATAALAVRYMQFAAWAAPVFCAGFIVRYSMEGAGVSRPVLVTGVTGFVVNGVLDVLLMHGVGPFPELGAAGCGLATAGAGVVMTAVFFLQFRVHPRFRNWHAPPATPAVDVPSTGAMLRLGVPIGLIWLAEAGLFSATGLLVARFGETAAAAHQIAINVAALAFMVPMGLGLAATARVGEAVGRGDTRAERVRGQTAIVVAVSFAAASAGLMVAAPEFIIGLYTDAPAVFDMAVGFLGLAALFQLADCVQATASGALRGRKDTRAPMVVTICAYWGIGVPLGAWLAFGVGMGPTGLWWGLIAGLVVAAAGLTTRLWRATGLGVASV